MNENLKKLFETVRDDEAMAKKFKECKTPEEAYSLATSMVDGYSLEEFKEVMANVNKQNSSDELSDSDLESVAGGLSDSDIIGITGVCVSAAAAAASC